MSQLPSPCDSVKISKEFYAVPETVRSLGWEDSGIGMATHSDQLPTFICQLDGLTFMEP